MIAREYGCGSSSVQRSSSITWPVLQRKYQMLIGAGAALDWARVPVVPPYTLPAPGSWLGGRSH